MIISIKKRGKTFAFLLFSRNFFKKWGLTKCVTYSIIMKVRCAVFFARQKKDEFYGFNEKSRNK